MFDSPPYKLLVADGDGDFASLCRQFFSRYEFDVRTVSSGFACLHELCSWKPDLLILDDELRWGKSDRILDHVKVAHLVSDTTLVILTGNDRLQSYMQDNDSLYLTKPFMLSTALELIRDSLAASPNMVYEN